MHEDRQRHRSPDDKRMHCPHCRSSRVTFRFSQRYYFCEECHKLLWGAEADGTIVPEVKTADSK